MHFGAKPLQRKHLPELQKRRLEVWKNSVVTKRTQGTRAPKLTMVYDNLGLRELPRAVRGIRRLRYVQIEKPLVCGVIGRITISVRLIICGAMGGKFLALRRLRKLPNSGKRDATRRRQRKCGWSTTRRRRTRVVVNPKRNVQVFSMIANVSRSGDGHRRLFLNGDSRAINAGAVTCLGKSNGPGSQVRMISG